MLVNTLTNVNKWHIVKCYHFYVSFKHSSGHYKKKKNTSKFFFFFFGKKFILLIIFNKYANMIKSETKDIYVTKGLFFYLK